MKYNLRKQIAIIFAFVLINNLLVAQSKNGVEFGGALRFNYRYKAWDKSNTDIGGDLVYDVFKLNAKATYNDLFLDVEYRFYPSEYGGGMLHHGFIGYVINPESQIHLGVHQVPFGLQPFASHSFFFNLPFYVGLEDDYDTGIKYIRTTEKWDFALAVYKNAEGARKWSTFSDGSQGYGVDPARYSYDLGTDLEELEQVNLRLARKFNDQEIGISVQRGRYIDHSKNEKNAHTAVAIHYNGNFTRDNRLNVKFEATGYSYDNSTNDLVSMVAYNYKYDIASEALILCGGLSYTIPTDFGPLKSITIYDDYNYMYKTNSSFNSTKMNVFGVLLTAGPIYTYIDYASGVNQDWLGPWGGFGENGDKYGFGQGAAKEEWNSWFNINVGYYF